MHSSLILILAFLLYLLFSHIVSPPLVSYTYWTFLSIINRLHLLFPFPIIEKRAGPASEIPNGITLMNLVFSLKSILLHNYNIITSHISAKVVYLTCLNAYHLRTQDIAGIILHNLGFLAVAELDNRIDWI